MAELATPSPILSFGCVSAGKRIVKQTAEGVEVSVEEDMIENNDKQEKTVVRLYSVQPKSEQECVPLQNQAFPCPVKTCGTQRSKTADSIKTPFYYGHRLCLKGRKSRKIFSFDFVYRL